MFGLYFKCVLVGCGLQFYQQFSGINTVMYYGPIIIQKTGLKLESIKDPDTLGIVLNIPLAFMNSLGTLLSLFFIDSLGRRYILLRTIPGVFISLLGVAFSMHCSNSTEVDVN